MNERAISNWMKLSEYDLETARAMLHTKRYLYVVFTCQQSIEKLLKAFFVKVHSETPPYTHNLVRLVELLPLVNVISVEQLDFLKRLNMFYIESRYTEELDEISKGLDAQSAQMIMNQTEAMISWIKSQIP